MQTHVAADAATKASRESIHSALISSLEQLAVDCKDLYVAYSGGLDSHVLLHALAQLIPLSERWRLHAIHINHGLQAGADQWASHCQQVCAALGLPYQCIELALQSKHPLGMEAHARHMRYAALGRAIGTEACLLTAHHADDQAETVLLQAMRGAGVDGLAAMPSSPQIFAQGYMLRPLLSLSRQQLAAYAQQHALSWQEDPSNKQRHIARNFMRHNIIPQLDQQRAGVVRNLQRVATNMAEAQSILMEVAANDYRRISVTGKPTQIKRQALMEFSPARQRLLLRYWLKQLRIAMPSRRALEALQSRYQSPQAEHAAYAPLMQWDKWHISLYRAMLYCHPQYPPIAHHWSCNWSGDRDCDLEHQLGTLKACDFPIKAWLQHFHSHELEIRLRRGGEVYTPHPEAKVLKLKDSLSKWQVPIWMRARIPLIYCGDTLLAIVGYWQYPITD